MESHSFSVKKYTSEDKSSWDSLVHSGKNSSFLFERNFMEYHNKRFQDFSLIIFKNEKPIAILPANVAENTVFSHQGLTYGGLILEKKTKLREAIEMFKSILKFLEDDGIDTLQIKLLPKIYNIMPSDEIDYILFLTNAKMIRTDVLSVIDNNCPLKIASNRMEGVKKGRNQNLKIEESNDFEGFWNQILIPNLSLKHGASPVHSLTEIKHLANFFPKNIKQYNVYKDSVIVGGATIFETKTVAHAQYISANQDKQQLGTLDFLFEYLIHERYARKLYFDFGVSNENQGKSINEGLLYWKECFGARSIAQHFYEVETANFKNLETLFV